MNLGQKLFTRRTVEPSREAAAAIEAADRSHSQAEADLAKQERLEPAVREVRKRLEAHNEANHWGEFLMELVSQPQIARAARHRAIS